MTKFARPMIAGVMVIEGLGTVLDFVTLGH